MIKLAKNITGITVVLAIVIILARGGLLGGAVDKAATDISTPMVDLLGLPFRLIKNGFTFIGDNKIILKRNKELFNKVKLLERQVNSFKIRENQYGQLEQLAKLKLKYNYDILPARIVLKDNMDWSKTIVINRGSRDGLMINMAVISGAGLVGKIIKTGYAYSSVLLLIDSNFKVGARLRNSRFAGLLEGQGMNQLVLNYLPREATFNEGEEVVTSGLGGIFPAGYLIGTIKKTHFEEYGFYKYVTVKPSVNFNTLETVAVVKRLPPKIDVPGYGD
ncbi:rod shape-determining protein MreC [bacterium]|nr:rod shape-determining protein MreC [bacterium]